MADKWRSSTWGEEISLEYGKALRGYDETHGQYRVFGSNGPIGWTSQPLSDGPGVILGRKGAYRGVHFSRDPFFVIDTAYYVVPRNEFDMRWLYYAIEHYNLGEVDDGSPIPSTTRSAVYMLDFEIPPFPEQRAIAHILGTLDDKIELNQRINETLEAIARALFKSWFVDFDPVRAKAEGRDPGLPKHIIDLFPDSFEDSDLSEIPKGWEVKPIRDFIERLPVGQKYEQKTVSESGNVPVLDQGKSGVIGYHDNAPGVIASPDEPVVVFANHTCYMRLIPFPFSAIQNVLPFIGKTVDTLWAFYATYGKQSFVEYKGHWPDLIIHKVAVPKSELTSEFARLVRPVVKQIWMREDESRTLAVLRDTLLSKLISGELPVKDAEKFIGRAV